MVALAASSRATCAGGQVPADGAEVLPQLLLVARADDDGRDRGPLQQPVERDLRHRLAGLRGDLVERVDDPVEVLVGDRRADVRRPACCCSRLVSGSGCPRRILPVSRPQPSGLQTTVPTF